MKFDVVIGNPPYQGNDGGNKAFAPPVYHTFMDAAYMLGRKVLLVTPGRFLFNAGATPKAWNEEMLNNEHLQILEYFGDSSDVFPNVNIAGGVAITYLDKDIKVNPIVTFTPYTELQNVLNKVRNHVNYNSIIDIVYSSSTYRLSERLFDEYDDESVQLRHKDTRLESNVFNKVPIIFKNSCVEITDKDILSKLYGLYDNKRTIRWIETKYLNVPDNHEKYKVFVPTVNAIGYGEVLSSPFVAEPKEGYTRTFISLGSFDNESSATNCLIYLKSKFARSLLGVLKATQHNPPRVWKEIPLQDFTENSDIDWSKSIPEIDQQLYKKYGLSEEEITFIETHVKEME